MKDMDTKLENVVRELMDFIEENSLCDIQNIAWLADEDCYIENERSQEMKEIIQKVKEALGE